MVFLSINVVLYILEAFTLGIYQNLEDISQRNSLISQILWLLWNILLQFMITFSLLKVYHQALKSTNLFHSLTIILKVHHYLQLNSKVSVTKSISLIPGDNFFLPFIMITMLLHLLLVVPSVPILISHTLINITTLIPIIAIDYCIVKNINYSLYVLAWIRIVGLMENGMV